jgi:hypothetical protein
LVIELFTLKPFNLIHIINNVTTFSQVFTKNGILLLTIKHLIMKKILLITAIFLSAFCYKTEAQLRFHVNIGLQPAWGPTGYDYVNYYYLPDLGVYYDVQRGLFVYFDMGQWNFTPVLPARFGNYDLYHSYKVVVNDRNPWLRNDYYRNQYYSYRGRYQPEIRDNHDSRYYAANDRRDRDRNNFQRPDERDNRGNFGRDNDRRNDNRRDDRRDRRH